jgi:hypothetical protein
VLDGDKGQARAERGFRFLKAPQFLAFLLRLRSWRRPPLLVLDDVKVPNCQKNHGFNGLGSYSEWPKVADAVTEAPPSISKSPRAYGLLMVMTVCVLVYAALEYRIRTAMKEHGATFPDQKGRRIPNPTTRRVFHYFVGIHVLSIPGQGLMILNLTDAHQHLLELLGKRYAWFYR